MKKIFTIVGLMLMATMVLSACGGGAATPAADQGPGEDTGTVFILGAFRGTEQDAFESVVAAFEEANPDIDVLYSGTAEFETLITVRVEAGDAPDIAAFPQP
ncbi:MAG: extracellular solute-binding protein, partial [Anaerolineales bacterium]